VGKREKHYKTKIYEWIGQEKVKNKPPIITNEEEQLVDKLLSDMRKQLVIELSPLLRVRKELYNTRKELVEVLDENKRLKNTLQKKDEFVGLCFKKIGEQSNKIIEDFVKYFGGNKEDHY